MPRANVVLGLIALPLCFVFTAVNFHLFHVVNHSAKVLYPAWRTTTTPFVVGSTKNATSNDANDNNKSEPSIHSSSSNNDNKTLVILIGELRGGELTWATIHKHVLDVNQADLALIMDANNNATSSSLVRRAKYIWTAPAKYTDWADAMEVIPNKPPDWRHRVFSNITHPNFIALGGAAKRRRGSGAIIFMLRYFCRLYIQQLGLQHRYERFIITRSDHYFCSPHDIAQLDADKIWVPRGQNFRGLSDRHAVVPARYVLQALDILSPILQHTERYLDVLRRKSFNTEQLLKLRWHEEGLMDHVARFERNMFLAADSVHQNGWKKISQKNATKFGVYFKYKLEFTAAKATCSNHLKRHGILQP